MRSRDPRSSLPPGFRFHPTDEELILHYLRKKVSSSPVPISIIADVDIYKFDPWDLPVMASFGEKEWYFFTPRDRKYPNGARPNRAAASGYWKATGTDKMIAVANVRGFQENIGVKKALVFYQGRPPKGVKTNWIMHEYRLADTLSPKTLTNPRIGNSNSSSSSGFGDGRSFKSKESSMRLDDWVLCRIYEKSHASSSSSPAVTSATSDQEQEDEELFVTRQTLFPNPVNDNTSKPQKSCSFSNLLDTADLSFLSNCFLAENPENQTEFEFPSLFGSNDLENFGDGFLDQKLPQLTTSPPLETDHNNNKRQRSDFGDDDDHETRTNPSKEFTSICSYNNTMDQFDHSFLNQQFLLSPHLQFQG